MEIKSSVKEKKLKLKTLKKIFDLHFMPRGFVSVNSSDLPCKDDNAGFTTVPLIPKPNQNCGR